MPAGAQPVAGPPPPSPFTSNGGGSGLPPVAPKPTLTGADVLVQNLIAQGVRRVYCIPGAKIDRVLETLRRTDAIEMVLCRNEQTAAFMAAGHGRRTGRAGVVLVTSGPGVTNLATALATANCEGDPVVALGGAVPISQRYKATHQARLLVLGG